MWLNQYPLNQACGGAPVLLAPALLCGEVSGEFVAVPPSFWQENISRRYSLNLKHQQRRALASSTTLCVCARTVNFLMRVAAGRRKRK